MIAEHLVEILRCPQDRSRLRVAGAEIVASINREVEAGRAVNLAGEKLAKPIDGGLIREAGDLLYPIVDQIPVMLPDEAIDLTPYQ
jgi:uncharacterized protein YbaR (Trm112 family)